MIERATVTAANPGRVDVVMEPSEACAGCGACSAGNSGSRLLSGIVDSLGAHPGDTVEIVTPAGARTRAQWLVYVVPVASLVLGYLAGFLLSDRVGVTPDTGGAVIGLMAAAAALAATRLAGRNAAGASRYEPRVHAIISRGQSAGVRSTDRTGLTPPTEEDTTRE